MISDVAWVQGGKGLVKDEKLRVHDQDVRQGHLLFLSSAQGVGGTMAEGGDAQLLDDLLHLSFGFRLRKSQIERAKGDLLVHAGRKELHVRVLEYDPYLFAQVQQFLFPVGDRLAVIVYLSLIWPQDAVAA